VIPTKLSGNQEAADRQGHATGPREILLDHNLLPRSVKWPADPHPDSSPVFAQPMQAGSLRHGLIERLTTFAHYWIVSVSRASRAAPMMPASWPS